MDVKRDSPFVLRLPILAKILSSSLSPTLKEMILETDIFDDRQVEDLQMMTEIIHAMAIADGFQNLDACLEKHPKRIKFYRRYASAALQAMRRVQGDIVQAGGDEFDTETKEEILPTPRIIKGGLADTKLTEI